MKLSSVALSISAVALTASAASIPTPPQSPRIAIRFGHKSKFFSPDDMEKPLTKAHPKRENTGEGQPGNHPPTARAPLVFMMKRARPFQLKAQEASSDFNKRPVTSAHVPCEHEATPSALPRTVPQPQQIINPLPPSRRMAQSGMPGFMKVSIPNSNSGLARTVSGLAYSTKPASGGAGFDLGTSPSHSTQFFMSPMNETDGAALYQLSVPILDKATFETIDHCATFATSPPGSLSLQKCGPMVGSSQSFSYDSTTGKLQPVYTSSATGLLAGSRWNVLPLTRDSDRSAEFSPFEANSRAVPVSASKSEAPAGPDATLETTASPVLYFVPEQGFYKPSSDISDAPTLPVLNPTQTSDDKPERKIVPNTHSSNITA